MVADGAAGHVVADHGVARAFGVAPRAAAVEQVGVPQQEVALLRRVLDPLEPRALDQILDEGLVLGVVGVVETDQGLARGDADVGAEVVGQRWLPG